MSSSNFLPEIVPKNERESVAASESESPINFMSPNNTQTRLLMRSMSLKSSGSPAYPQQLQHKINTNNQQKLE